MFHELVLLGYILIGGIMVAIFAGPTALHIIKEILS